MEIEAKFAIPDLDTFHRLLAAETLAGMRLVPGPTQEIHDRYLDTPRQTIRHAGYACRLRQRAGKRLITFKGLHGAEGAIHQRAEHEVILPPGATLAPDSWPHGPARALAEQLCQHQPLETLFDLYQTRHIRMLTDGDRTVAEFSLDHVRPHCPARSAEAEPAAAHASEIAYLELEVELTLGGTMSDLHRVVRELTTHWRLRPEPRSKFERALAILDEQITESRSP